VAFVPSGGEFRVNSQTGGDQATPAIAALASGGFLVVWDDASGTLGDSDGRSIKAQFYDSSLTPVGGEFLVNAQTTGNQARPRVATLSDGRFVVTWTDGSGVSDGSFSGVVAQIFDPSGGKVGPEFVVNTVTNSTQAVMEIAALTNGGFVVNWEDIGGKVKTQVYDASGTRVGGEILADTVTGIGPAPDVAGLPGGNFVVTWADDNGSRVKARLYDATGAAFDPEITVSSGSGSAPDVASLFGGKFVITWADPSSTSGDIRAQIFDDGGNKLGAEFPVNTTTTSAQDSPSIAAVTGGGFVISWTDFSAGIGNADVRARIFDSTGNAVGSDFLVNTQASLNQSAPAIVGMPGDGFVIAWTDQSGTLGDASGSSIKAQVYQDDAAGVNEPPVNTVPGTLTAGHDPLTINVSFTDDAVPPGSIIFPGYPGAHTLTLTAAHGTLTGSIQKFYRDFATVEGGGTRTVKFTANPEILNGGIFVQYQADPAFFGTDTVTMTVNDAGETGSGGPKSDTDSFNINVGPMFTGTPGDDTFAVSQGPRYEGYFGGAGNDTLNFPFSLSALSVRYEDSGLIIEHAPTLTKALLVDIETVVFPDGTVQQADGSPLIDDLYYYAHNHDVWAAQVDADQHYNTSGWREGRDPNAFFSNRLYLATNPDVAAAGIDPLAHFDSFGWREGRIPSIAFDPAQYLAAYPDVAAANIDPLAHFLQFGLDEGRKAFAPTKPIVVGDFDYRYYLTRYQDVAASGVDPLQHFQQFGWKEGRNPNALFDTSGYLASYADVAASGSNPLDHYNQFGWHEGRDPSVSFDTTSYLAAYPDVAAANVNPLALYLQFGFAEGRQTFADGVWG
jgi:hypothetical protein